MDDGETGTKAENSDGNFMTLRKIFDFIWIMTVLLMMQGCINTLIIIRNKDDQTRTIEKLIRDQTAKLKIEQAEDWCKHCNN